MDEYAEEKKKGMEERRWYKEGDSEGREGKKRWTQRKQVKDNGRVELAGRSEEGGQEGEKKQVD